MLGIVMDFLRYFMDPVFAKGMLMILQLYNIGNYGNCSGCGNRPAPSGR